MKKLIKISMIIITLALLCSCTSEVKQVSTSNLQQNDVSTNMISSFNKENAEETVVKPNNSENTTSVSNENAKNTKTITAKDIKNVVSLFKEKKTEIMADLCDSSKKLLWKKSDEIEDGDCIFINLADFNDDSYNDIMLTYTADVDNTGYFACPYNSRKTVVYDGKTHELLFDYFGGYIYEYKEMNILQKYKDENGNILFYDISQRGQGHIRRTIFTKINEDNGKWNSKIEFYESSTFYSDRVPMEEVKIYTELSEESIKLIEEDAIPEEALSILASDILFQLNNYEKLDFEVTNLGHIRYNVNKNGDCNITFNFNLNENNSNIEDDLRKILQG